MFIPRQINTFVFWGIVCQKLEPMPIFGVQPGRQPD